MSSQKRRDSLPNWWSTKTSPKIPLFLTAKGWSNFIWNPNMFTKFYSIQDVSKSCHLRDGSIQIHIHIYIYATFFYHLSKHSSQTGQVFYPTQKKTAKNPQSKHDGRWPKAAPDNDLLKLPRNWFWKFFTPAHWPGKRLNNDVWHNNSGCWTESVVLCWGPLDLKSPWCFFWFLVGGTRIIWAIQNSSDHSY